MKSKNIKSFLLVLLLPLASVSFFIIGKTYDTQSEAKLQALKKADIEKRISQLNNQATEVSNFYNKEVEWSELLLEKSSHDLLFGLYKSSDYILWKYKGKLFIGFDILEIKSVEAELKKVVFNAGRAKIIPNSFQITSRETIILNNSESVDGSKIDQYKREEEVEKAVETRIKDAVYVFHDSEFSLEYKLNKLVKRLFDSKWEVVIEWMD